jgi:protein SCO1/2
MNASRPFRCLMPLFLLAAMAMAGGCAKKQNWDLANITGVVKPLEFSLINDTGHEVTNRTYHGKVVMLYFGYTHCPDVCPTTLANLAQALSKLGGEAENVKVLFVTVDPKRDDAGVLKNYTRAFGPEFVGLRTSDDEVLRKLAKRYRVTYSLGKPDANGNYEVTHSSAVFIFDGSGKARLIAEPGDSTDAIAHDLKQLIHED